MKNETEKHADAGGQRLAKVYAGSLLNVADKSGHAGAIVEEIDSLLDDVFKGDTRLEVLFSSAAAGPAVRRATIEKAFKGRASETVYRFLQVLNDHERLELLRPIRTALHALYEERNQKVKVHVYSAIELSEQAQAHIGNVVRKEFAIDPIVVAHVDPALLGGLKVRIGDKQFDGTVRTRIDNLRTQILARSSHEIQSRRDRFSTAS